MMSSGLGPFVGASYEAVRTGDGRFHFQYLDHFVVRDCSSEACAQSVDALVACPAARDVHLASPPLYWLSGIHVHTQVKTGRCLGDVLSQWLGRQKVEQRASTRLGISSVKC